MRRKHLRWLSAIPVLAATTALAMTSGAAASPVASASAACTKATNIEAIIDDSGSMSGTDSGKFRASLLEILAGQQGNTGKKMGAVEFGDFGSVLFAPLAIGNAAAQASVTAALAPTINADGSTVPGDFAGTNYDAGFDAAKSANPTTDARIFLSDGEPNTYTRATHLNPATKTYVVGFGGVGSSSAPLNEIVSDTGGHLFALTNSSQVQPVAGALTAVLNCKKPPITKTAVLSQGELKGYSFKATGKTADILVTWPTTTATIVPSLGAGGGKTASVAKVQFKVQKGPTFSSVHLKGIKKGQKIKFKIKAKKAAGPTTVTTQIIR